MMIAMIKETRPRKMGEIVEEHMRQLLDEGYFKSFPDETTRKSLEKVLKNQDQEYLLYSSEQFGEKDLYNDYQLLYLQMEKISKPLEKKLTAVLDQCGWYIADQDWRKDLESYLIIMEPKFPIENSHITEISEKIINKIGTFYHITFRKYESKILKNGLVPSFSKRSEFNHPERIYLFGDRRIAEDFVRDHKTKLLNYSKKIYRRKIGNTQFDADEKYQKEFDPNLDIVGFEVDLKKMMSDGKLCLLYHDNRWDNDSPVFFTQNTILPQYLKAL